VRPECFYQRRYPCVRNGYLPGPRPRCLICLTWIDARAEVDSSAVFPIKGPTPRSPLVVFCQEALFAAGHRFIPARRPPARHRFNGGTPATMMLSLEVHAWRLPSKPFMKMVS